MKLIAIAQLGVFMVVYTERDFLKGTFLVSIKYQLKSFFFSVFFFFGLSAFQPKTEIDSLTRDDM